MPVNKVKAHIEVAFKDTPYPGDEFNDISGTIHDEGIVEYFRGTGWQGHQVKDLRYHCDALAIFTDRAFRFWLPAFMLAVLEDSEAADCISDFIPYHFSDSYCGENGVAAFLPNELQAIVTFLRYCEAQCGDNDNVYKRAFRESAEFVESTLREA